MNTLNCFKTIGTFLLELIFPPRCVICNNIMAKSTFSSCLHICDDCNEKLRFTDHLSVCKKCSRPISDENILCSVCQSTKHNYDVAFSCVIYENEMRRSLLSYKFYNAYHKHRTYSEIMLSKIKTTSHFPSFDLIASVPLSKARKKKRGYDHVAPFAKYISKTTNIPYDQNMLIKIKDTKPQSKLSFKERALSVKGAYITKENININGKSILLIDDIYTTGATIDEISGVLKKKGARYVTVLTLCITPDLER